jgi:uncharacterized protein YbjT (DUF2867 family)
VHVVAGVSGNTGGATARALLEHGAPVRAVVRQAAQGQVWADRGAELVIADLADSSSLTRALDGAESAYVLNPPAYTAPDLFRHAQDLACSIREAARQTRLPRLVVLSSIGAHRPTGTGIIATNRTFEQVLDDAAPEVSFLRPAYFMENWSWVAAAAMGQGVLPSFLTPLERSLPMVSTSDVGRVAADLMRAAAPPARIVELEGPLRCSPQDAARAFSVTLGRPVAAVPVPPADWPAALAASRFSPLTIEAWTELFAAFNSGWIDFERSASVTRGRVPIDEAVAAIVRRA